MGQDLGVGLRLKEVPLLLELGAEGGVVLDNPIVDESQFAGAVEVRVRVLTGDLAMGGPAGMADACGAADGVFREGSGQVVDPADLLADGDHSLLEGGDPGGIIPPVFKATESFQKDGNGLGAADITYDSTHKGIREKGEGGGIGPRPGVKVI
jgi:hypothetical protein